MNQGNGMYNGKVSLIIGVHCHQPVGNFSHVFEDAWKRCYHPFLNILREHPRIKVTLHYSGVLLEWFKENYPEGLKIIQELIERGQAEVMTGGFYEPILPIIPDRDRLGQIEMLTDFILKHFSFKPRGLWLAERIWEPHLPRVLSQADVEYTIVDDSHFRLGGMKKEDVFGYFLTEDEGAVLKVFPIDKHLRYLIPFRLPEETISYLKSIATEDGERVAVIADDGEKFGLWPGTYKWVYEEGWLEKFFCSLENNADWIRLTTFSEYLDTHPARGSFYIPTASYDEMMEWLGGFFRNFFAKYPEANDLHKKMLYVSEKVSRLKGKRKEEASRELYRGQCNCAYWHGVFGGLYLKHLRSAVQEHLIRAERMADSYLEGEGEWLKADGRDLNLEEKKEWLKVETEDLNMDGQEEILINSHLYNLYLSPGKGGSLYQLDYKPKSVNLLDTLTRRPEAYHEKLDLVSGETASGEGETPSIHEITRAKEKNLKEYLFYDWHRRSSFLDHFLSADTTFDDFRKSKYGEQGDFVNQAYQYEISSSPDDIMVILSREGNLFLQERQSPLKGEKQVKVEKRVKVGKGEKIEIFYCISNLCTDKIGLWFGIEFNLSLPSGNSPGCDYYFSGRKERVDSSGIAGEQKEITLRDEPAGLKVSLSFSQPALLWHFPLETVSQSESGFERTYQGSVILPNWLIPLDGGEKWELMIQKTIEMW